MRRIPSSRAKDTSLKAIARNDAIENRLLLDSLKAKNEISILLLGAGGSERSVVRQMKLLHSGLTDRERVAYKEAIFSNIAQDMRAILEAMPALEIPLAPLNDAHRATVLSLPGKIEADVLPRDIADAIRGLWLDPGVKEAVRRSKEFQIYENAVYYFNSIDRIATTNYLPSDQDIVRCRVKATGVAETSFQVGELTYRIFDPSGQRSERRKWLHCFEKVKAVLFCADLTEYDQFLYEDESVNRLQEALTLFDSICNSRWFVTTSIILFLNIDGLANKLPRNPLADYFPDYTGGDNYDAACDYLLHRFVSLDQSTATTRQTYAHYVSTADSQQMKFVLSAMQDILLQNYLRE
ncbi:heterotrimeric G protein alpha subunit B [Mycena galericulata]|nr:heterotrimeric G protein alpha subunit B [Mycena galericulata]